MDKREVIAELEALKKDNNLNHLSKGYEQEIEIVKKLEDSELVSIPQFMNAFILEAREELACDPDDTVQNAEFLFKTVLDFARSAEGLTQDYIEIDKMETDWFWNNKKTYERAIMEGYTVIPEERWLVLEPTTKQILVRAPGGFEWTRNVLPGTGRFTKDEIKVINPIYWEYRVEVENDN